MIKSHVLHARLLHAEYEYQKWFAKKPDDGTDLSKIIQSEKENQQLNKIVQAAIGGLNYFSTLNKDDDFVALDEILFADFHFAFRIVCEHEQEKLGNLKFQKRKFRR